MGQVQNRETTGFSQQVDATNKKGTFWGSFFIYSKYMNYPRVIRLKLVTFVPASTDFR